jgi:hypothetical protein
MTSPAQHGLAIRPAPTGWALFKHDRQLFASNDRQRVEGAMRQELEKLELGALVRKAFAADRRSASPPPPQPRRPEPTPVPRPMAEQHSSALHEAAHAATAWAMGYPVNEVWVHREGPNIREDGAALHGFTISRWPTLSEEDYADAAVICLAGPILTASEAGASLGELMDKPERLEQFGGWSDLAEAQRQTRKIGPDYARALTGQWYPGDELLSTLVYRTSRWIRDSTMERMIGALASALLDDDGYGRLTSSEIDRVLKDALPSWNLRGGKSRW